MPALRWTPRRRNLFIKALGQTGNVSSAAKTASVSRSHAYALRSADEDFAARWSDALETAVDQLESEARRRAIDGVESPHFHQGKVTGTVTKYSDSLLMFLLKAHRPDRYRDKAADNRDADDTLANELSQARDSLEARIAGLDQDAVPGDEDPVPE